MEKVQTGIKGFDALVEGGMPIGSTILLSGTPGTGKTIFSLEFLYNGATRFKEKGLYVSFEEKKSNLINQASSFGWDIPALEKKRMLFVHSIPASSLEKDTPNSLLRMIKNNGITRVVIDSLSTLTMNTPTINNHPHTMDTLTVKRFVYDTLQKLSLSGATTILVSHSHNESMFSIDGVSEFICDGIIKIYSETLGGEYSRALRIAKMRSIKNNEDIHPMEIGSSGIVIHSIK